MIPRLALQSAAAAFILIGVGAGTSNAVEVTRQELGALARRALEDPTELAELREVDRVDGRPVDLGRALEGADRKELSNRLEALTDFEDAIAVDPDRARSKADSIVSEERFRAEGPRPLRGLLARIGAWLRPLDRLLDRIASVLPGRRAALWGILAVAVVTVAAAVAIRAAGGRAGLNSPPRMVGDGPAPDFRLLEREAAAAEARSEFGEAVRLRFRAGLLRLDHAGAIEFGPSLTSREVATMLRSATFNALAEMFDQIVYGGRPAARADALFARTSWEQLQSEVAVR